MKSKDRYINDVFIDYFLQSLKYESVYLCAWDIDSHANAAIDPWITFYNHWRPHALAGSCHMWSASTALKLISRPRK